MIEQLNVTSEDENNEECVDDDDDDEEMDRSIDRNNESDC